MAPDFNFGLGPFGSGVVPQSGVPAFSLGTPNLSPEIDMSKAGGSGFGGLTPANWAAIAGQLGMAIGGDSVGGRISQVAANIGQTQLKAAAAQEQQKQQMAFLKEILKKGGDLENLTPEQAKVLGLSTNLSLLGASPSGATGLETGTITPAKLSTSNSPSLY